jgi:hypothetical protein
MVKRLAIPDHRLNFFANTMKWLVLWFVGFFIFVLPVYCGDRPQVGASSKVALGERGWRPDGLLCYRSREGERTKVHLIRLGTDTVETIFVKEVGRIVAPPFFCGDSVIAVHVDGTINKFDLSGRLVFSEKPAKFNGVAGLSGTVNERCLYVTETVPDEKRRKPSYYLCLVAVDGERPEVKKKFRLPELGIVKVNLMDKKILVIGRKGVHKFEIPRFFASD